MLLCACLLGWFFSVQDFWCGFKFFCYAYFSHSVGHESEFWDSKLGSCHSTISSPPFCFSGLRLDFCLLWDALRVLCVRGFRVSMAIGFLQVSSYGAVSVGCPHLCIVQFAMPACSCSPAWSCYANVSSMKIATTFGH